MARHHMVDGVAVPFTPEEETQADAEEAQGVADQPKRDVMRKIQELESGVTSRRIIEAIAGNDGGWLAALASQIGTERGKL